LTRPTIDQTLMAVAQAWALRGTCSRLQVGAVLAQDGRTIASGYNGSPSGTVHCSHEPESSERCAVAVHAETNVIGYAARAGARAEGGTLYVTHAPCEHCAPVVIAAGIGRVVFAEPYGSGAGIVRLGVAGVLVQQLGPRMVRCQWCGNVTALDELDMLAPHSDSIEGELPAHCAGSHGDDYEDVDALPGREVTT
jgi:dCMP deaminase